MATSYQWVIQQMVCKPTEEGLQDVVIQANWLYKGILTNEEGKIEVSVVEAGQTTFSTPPSPESFIPYENLTQEQVISWIESNTNMTELNALIDYDINQKMNPPIVILPLPWEQ